MKKESNTKKNFEDQAEKVARDRFEQELDTLLLEAVSIRGDIQKLASKLGDIYQQVSRTVKSRGDQNASTYVLLANNGYRLAGMIHQGITRVSSVEGRLQKDTEERKRSRELEEKRFFDDQKVKRSSDKVQETPNTSDYSLFSSLYGDEP